MTTRSENRKNLTPSSTLKLEEFFSTRCKDEVFAVLDMFPEEKSVVVDYN